MADDARIIEHMLAGGGMLPTQVNPAGAVWTPEKRLAAAVLASALVSVRDHHGDPRRTPLVEEDLGWIREDQGLGPFSFTALCDTFGIEPDWVRENVERWLRQRRGRRPPFSMHRHAA